MRLNVNERLALLGLLPKEGDFLTLKVIRDLQEALSFSEEEHTALQFKELDNNQVVWLKAADPNKEFDFEPKATQIIVSSLEKANTQKKLTIEHMSIYEKFIGE